MIVKLDYYNPKKKFKVQKKVLFLMQENFTKEEKLFVLHLKMMHFHCLNNIHQVLMIGKKMKWIHHIFCLVDLINHCHQLSVEEKTLKKKECLKV